MPVPLHAIDTQDRIGWLAFFEGCIAVEWAVQEAHFIWLGRRNTGKRWATSLIVKLWEVATDLWDHCNQVKKHVEMAQEIARRGAIMLAVHNWNVPLAGLASHAETGASLNALSSPLFRDHCTTWTPGYSGSKLHAHGKPDKTQTLSILPLSLPKTSYQASMATPHILQQFLNPAAQP